MEMLRGNLPNTLPETNSSPLKIGFPKKKVVFQTSNFRCYVSFREGIYNDLVEHVKIFFIFLVVAYDDDDRKQQETHSRHHPA